MGQKYQLMRRKLICDKVPGDLGGLTMNDRASTAVAMHRARKTRAGFVRVEVTVRGEDASLVRDVAAALSDPDRHHAARQLLRQEFRPPAAIDLKALLASAPLDGIDIERDRDPGRPIRPCAV
jgi:hypothetical protein